MCIFCNFSDKSNEINIHVFLSSAVSCIHVIRPANSWNLCQRFHSRCCFFSSSTFDCNSFLFYAQSLVRCLISLFHYYWDLVQIVIGVVAFSFGNVWVCHLRSFHSIFCCFPMYFLHTMVFVAQVVVKAPPTPSTQPLNVVYMLYFIQTIFHRISWLILWRLSNLFRISLYVFRHHGCQWNITVHHKSQYRGRSLSE